MSTSRSRILVAADESEASDEAVRQADARARSTGAELIVCTVMPAPLLLNPMMPTMTMAVDVGVRLATVEAELRARVALLTKREPAEFEVRVLDGRPHAAIVEEAERLAVDLLVVGSNGRSGLGRLLLGSVAERVLRYAHCSVLVARQRRLTGNVLVATDFSDPALPAVHAAVDEATRLGGRVTAAHAIDLMELDWSSMPLPSTTAGLAVPEAAIDEMRRDVRQRLVLALSSFGATGDTLLLEGPPADAIVKAAQEIDAQLIVVGTAGRTGLRRVLLGSVAEAVVRIATTSVLVVRLNEAPVAA